MGTHPIFESDFDCLTDKKLGFRTMVNVPKTRKTFSKSVNKHTNFKVTQYKAGKLRCMPRVSVVTIASSLDMVVRPSPCFTKRLKPLKRSFFDLNAPSPRRRSF